MQKFIKRLKILENCRCIVGRFAIECLIFLVGTHNNYIENVTKKLALKLLDTPLAVLTKYRS